MTDFQIAGWRIVDARGYTVAELSDDRQQPEANAARICLCCNTHDDLVTAIERAIHVIENYADAPDFVMRMQGSARVPGMLDELHRALARAKGAA